MVRRAFSLVELLVVVGIIAFLIALMLPTIGRAREAASRTICLSNLRQVHQAFMLYALANHDQVPLGYRRDPVPSAQFNSMIYSQTTGAFCLFGWLYNARLMTQPRIFYCPSERDPREQFDTAQNPWPANPDVPPTTNVYAGYGCRAEVALPDTPDGSVPLPHLTAFYNKAIFADLISVSTRIDSRHRQGVNVLYGNGSAHWVDRQNVDASVNRCGNPFPVTSAYNRYQENVWAALDRG